MITWTFVLVMAYGQSSYALSVPNFSSSQSCSAYMQKTLKILISPYTKGPTVAECVPSDFTLPEAIPKKPITGVTPALKPISPKAIRTDKPKRHPIYY